MIGACSMIVKIRLVSIVYLLVMIQILGLCTLDSIDAVELGDNGLDIGLLPMGDVKTSTQYISNGTWGNNRDTTCLDTAVDDSGYLYTVGQNYLRGSPTDPHPDTILIKWGPDATTEWDLLIENTTGNSVVVDSSNLYITGSRYNNEGSMVYVAKRTQSGDFLWETNWSWLEYGVGHAMDIAPDGSIYVFCTSSIPGGPIYRSLIKLDNDGGLLWNRTLLMSGNSFINYYDVHAPYQNEIYLVVDESIYKYNSQGDEAWNVEGEFLISDTGPSGALYTLSPAEAPDIDSRACSLKRWNFPSWNKSLIVNLQATTLPIFSHVYGGATIRVAPDGAPYVVFPFQNSISGPILIKYGAGGNHLWNTSLVLPEGFLLDIVWGLEVSQNNTIFAIGHTRPWDTGRVCIIIATYEIGTLVPFPLTDLLYWVTILLITSLALIALVLLTMGYVFRKKTMGYIFRKKIKSSN
ncbi:MAG: hypothetical protein RTS72_05200 [Candidatus Thorarchaeota archaeon]